MRLRFWDRLLAAIAGLVLFLLGLVVFLWGIRGIPKDWLDVLTAKTVSRLILFLALGVGVVMAALGAHSLSFLWRRKQDKKGFVVQHTEHGELSISIHAMENLVKKCVDMYEEMRVTGSHIENTRDGVVVDLRISLASGVSIPLVVNTLQKQIKQYITSCSGIDVAQVRVQVETTGDKADYSPYAVKDNFAGTSLKAEPVESPPPSRMADVPMRTAEPPARANVDPTPRAAEPPVMYKPAMDPRAMGFPETAPDKDEKKRPLHQRLFGHREQPAIVPVPPQLEQSTIVPVPPHLGRKPGPDTPGSVDLEDSEQEDSTFEFEPEPQEEDADETP